MNRDEILSQKSPKDLEIDRLSSFPDAEYLRHPKTHEGRPSGVLLGDEIEFYCKNYRLLDPYKPSNIKAANYELRVGLRYSVGGERHELAIGESLTIPRFEVAVVEILETINMPHFLIGRWNIRTRWAYKGLIWVGGPQVDAGYRGLLMCPLWNLSNEPFTIKCSEEIAIIDFEATTPPTERSREYEYKWRTRSRFVFDEYEPEKLHSGLVDEAVRRIEKVEGDLKGVQLETKEDIEHSRNRIDGVTVLMFTALGVLTTAIAVIVTKQGDVKHFWEHSMFWLSSGTLLISLLAWAKAHSPGKWWKGVHMWIAVVATVAIAIQVYRSQLEINRLQDAEGTIQCLQRHIEALEGAKQSVSGQAKDVQGNCEFKQPATESK
jgi:deoxycytidine triphosphate deaminase